MRFYVFFIFSFCCAVLKAQVPGYLGKKNIAFVGGRASMIPASFFIYDPSDSKSNIDKTALFWNLGAKRIIGRSGTMGLSATYFRDDVFNAKVTDRVPSVFSGFDAVVDFRSYFYSAKGSIAPVGRHFRYNLIYSMYDVKTIENKIPVGKVMFFGVGLGTGSSRIVKDKIWIDYGWEFNWLFNVYDQQDMIKGWDYSRQVQRNLQNSYGVYFNLAVGYVY
ncbi:MAG: hypothetical protein ACKOXB_15470 [Flavobacteriales bacterium]